MQKYACSCLGEKKAHNFSKTILHTHIDTKKNNELNTHAHTHTIQDHYLIRENMAEH